MHSKSKITCPYQWDKTQRLYVCPLCGDTTKIENLHRVCPTLRQQKKKKVLHTLSPEELRRIEICQTCPNYIQQLRCKKIDLGCRSVFMQHLQSGKCPDRRWDQPQEPSSSLRWSYGVTTIPARFESHLRTTLKSLINAGFPNPRLFVDGFSPTDSVPDYLKNYQIVARFPRLRTFGNWILALWELYLRNPEADRFALFQDDCVAYHNLRQYLEACPFPDKGYLNLYLFPANQKKINGWYQSNQKGLGAVGLVFNNEGVRLLLQQRHMVDRPLNPKRGWKAIDGGIVTAMKNAGWREYVHNPSLLQHTGLRSSMGNGQHPQAPTFLGEDFDALDLLKDKEHVPAPIIPSRKRTERIGLVGYCCDGGLGTLNREIVQHVPIDAWLIKPHHRLPTKNIPTDIETIVCPSGSETKIQRFLNQVDTVLFCETPYYNNLIPLAKKAGKRIVCVPMMEWMPAGAKGWPRQVDLFVCPTQQCYDLFYKTVPCVEFQWPTNTSKFPFVERSTCESFLFVNGTGGWRGRKGLDVLQKCLQIWPEMPLVVRTQVRVSLRGPNVNVLLGEPDNASDLYAIGDVCLVPSKVDGLGLTSREAMSSGLPVIVTDGQPWTELPYLAKIPASMRRLTVKRPVDWYEPSPEALVNLCKTCLHRSVREDSIAARRWAESVRWEGRVDEFVELVRTGRQRMSLPFQPKETVLS